MGDFRPSKQQGCPNGSRILSLFCKDTYLSNYMSNGSYAQTIKRSQKETLLFNKCIFSK